MSLESLTPKQAEFVRQYAIDRNGTQAAIRAGYSPKTANEQASRLLANVNIRAAVDNLTQKAAEKTETEAEWVRRRLKEEADAEGPNASHAARIKALELIGKINGVFELDNKQKADGLTVLMTQLNGNVVGAIHVSNQSGEDEEGDDE